MVELMNRLSQFCPLRNSGFLGTRMARQPKKPLDCVEPPVSGLEDAALLSARGCGRQA